MAKTYKATRDLAWRLRNVLAEIPATGNAGTQSASTTGFIQHSKDMQTFNNFALRVMLEIARTPLSKADSDWAGEDEAETEDALQIMEKLERWLAWRTSNHWVYGAPVYHPNQTCDWPADLRVPEPP